MNRTVPLWATNLTMGGDLNSPVLLVLILALIYPKETAVLGTLVMIVGLAVGVKGYSEAISKMGIP